MRDDLVLFVSGKLNPTAGEWKTYCSVLADGVKQLRARNIDALRVLVVSDGGGPSGKQREEVLAAGGGIKVRTAAVSSDLMTRGILTALGWFGIDVKSCTPARAADAFAFLNIPAAQVGGLWKRLKELESHVDDRPIAALATAHKMYLERS